MRLNAEIKAATANSIIDKGNNTITGRIRIRIRIRIHPSNDVNDTQAST